MAKQNLPVPTPGPALPAVRQSSTLDIGANDISLPRLYLGQPQSESVQEGTVPAYSIAIMNGADDPDPNVIWTQEDGADKGPIFHVLAVKRGLYRQLTGQPLERWDFGDPSAPDDARTSYDYVIVLPEHEPEVPVKFLLKGTSSRTAKNINYLLKKHASKGEPYELAFQLWVKKDQNDYGRFSVAKAKPIEAIPEYVELSANLASLVAGTEVETAGQSHNQEPSI